MSASWSKGGDRISSAVRIYMIFAAFVIQNPKECQCLQCWKKELEHETSYTLLSLLQHGVFSIFHGEPESDAYLTGIYFTAVEFNITWVNDPDESWWKLWVIFSERQKKKHCIQFQYVHGSLDANPWIPIWEPLLFTFFAHWRVFRNPAR